MDTTRLEMEIELAGVFEYALFPMDEENAPEDFPYVTIKTKALPPVGSVVWFGDNKHKTSAGWVFMIVSYSQPVPGFDYKVNRIKLGGLDATSTIHAYVIPVDLEEYHQQSLKRLGVESFDWATCKKTM